MSCFKHFFHLSILLSLMSLSWHASSSERADHHKLKSFLDCEIKGQKDCELESPRVVDNKESSDEKEVVEIKKNETTPSQKFIFGPRQKRVQKGSSSSR